MTNKITKTSESKRTQQAKTSEEPHTKATVADQGAIVVSSQAASKKGASRKENAAQGRKKAKSKAAKPATAAAPNQPRQSRKKTDTPATPKTPRVPKPDSKGAQLLALIGREQGASLSELRQATGWQAHSVRGFLSTASKKQNLKISSTKNETGERIYTTGK
jgi:hypothetical protein